jgi:glycerol uptake facilitator-like aquaporin
MVEVGSPLPYEGILLAAILMFAMMAVATDTRAFGAGAAIAIGGTVVLDILVGGALTGASLNPLARSARRPLPVSGRTSGSSSWDRSSARA